MLRRSVHCVGGCQRHSGSGMLQRRGQAAHVFFLPPFLPLDMRLFLPTAMLAIRCLPAVHQHTKEAEHSDLTGALCAGSNKGL